MDNGEKGWVEWDRGRKDEIKRETLIIEIERGGVVPRMKPRPGPMISILNASPRIDGTRVDAKVGGKFQPLCSYVCAFL